MKFVFLPLGSAGDLHPMIWLARGVAARGHEVVMIAQAKVADMPRAAGLKVVEVGDPVAQEKLLHNPDIWHPKKGFKVLGGLFPVWAREMLPLVKAEAAGRSDVVTVAAGIALAGVLAREAWKIPSITVQLQPSVFMSVESTPVMAAGLEWLPRMPKFVRRAVFAVAHKQVDQTLAGNVNAIRHELGLQGQVRGIFKEYWFSPDGVLALFPDWFSPKQTDWPAQTEQARFPLYDESNERPIDAALEAFLADGERPVLFTPGSANLHGEKFFEAAAGACELLKCRGLFVTRKPEVVRKLPARSAVFAYVPFSRVFSRCAAVVHHGGVGSCAQGLAGGVPQLLMPMSHDQPDNAVRLKRMGVGDYLYPKHFTPARIADKLSVLMQDRAVGEACAKYRALMATQMSPDATAAIAEKMASQALAKRAV